MGLSWGWAFSSVVERLPRKHKALGSVPSSEKKNQKNKKWVYLYGFKAYLAYIVNSRAVCLKESKKIKKKITKGREGIGEKPQWLRALTALPEVLSSIPSNHMVAHSHL